jgi:DNA-binding NtrC family response regulator
LKEQMEKLVLQMCRSGILYREGIREFQKAFITVVLQELNGNVSRAAPKLGLHRNTLSRAIVELGVDMGTLRPSRRPPGRVTYSLKTRQAAR